MADVLRLENDRLRLHLEPDAGAGILAFEVRPPAAPATWLPIVPDARNEACPLRWASWMMIPYSNRIAEGRFTFEGETYRLRNGENHAIHGDTRDRPWSLEEHAADRACLRFRSADHEAVNWPWPFEARVAYALVKETLATELVLVNRGDSPMPAGFGFHPYFRRWLTREGEAVRLRAHVAGVYPDANDTRLPSGPPVAVPPELDFGEERPVPPDRPFDLCCPGYDGNGWIRWPESGVRAVFRCSEALSHLVLYNPVEHPYFAVEPVANANDGVNLLARGDPTSGVTILAPGDALEARFELRIETETPSS